MTPPSQRTVRLASSLLALLALGTTLTWVGYLARLDEPGYLDHLVHTWVVRHRASWPAVSTGLRLATRFGDPVAATAATVAVALGLSAAARAGVGRVGRGEALVWLGAILGGSLLCNGLKLLFRRDRPPPGNRLVFEDSFSFPSGHSVFAAVFFLMLAVLLVRHIPPRRAWARAGVFAACLSLALTVGLSRVWLGVHYPTDVLGGLLLGFGWVWVVVLTGAVVGGRNGE